MRHLAILLLAPLLVESLSATPIKVFLLGGQSNMRGRSSTSGLPSELANPQEDVLICRGSTGTIGTTLEFLQPNNVALDGATFGPDLNFGRTIADLYPSVDFALLKYAYGGTSLVRAPSGENWAYDPDGGSYLKFQQTVANGLALLEDAGYEPEIVGMLWHQGESNAGNSQAEYESRLTEFIADVRSLYGANLPFMIGGITIPDDTPQAANIVAAQQAVASADPFAAFVPVDDLTTSDRWHFDQPSMITLGQRFATYYNASFSNLIEDTSTDFTAPAPAQMTWVSPPAPISSSAISMTAMTASDEHGVQYQFTRYLGGAVESTSDWQDSPVYTDTGLLPSTTYTYMVQARDKSVNHNTNTPSSPAGATTNPADTIAPPVPTFITPLGPVTATSIQVNANPVVDGEGSGVEYRFHNTTLGTDSGWLSGPIWTNTGLTSGTTYSYTVQSRDTSVGLNESAPSSSVSATTLSLVAKTINLKLVGSGSATSTTSNPGYGLWGQGTETWNVNNSFTGTNLVDSTGAASTIGYAFTVSGAGAGIGKLDNVYGEDAIQLGGMYGARDAGQTSILTLTGLTVGTSYEIIVFMAENGSNGWGAMAFQGVNPGDFTGSLSSTGTDVYSDAFDGSATNGPDFWYWTGVTPSGSGEAVLTIDDPWWDVITAVQIREMTGTGSPYDSWSGGEPFDDDANADGVSNGVAWLLGAASPSETATGRLPAVSQSGGGLVLTFNCLPTADRGTAVLGVEHSSDLGMSDAWTGAEVPDADGGPTNGVSFVVDTVSEAPLNKVTATIDAGEAAGGKLFGRIHVAQP